jgi:hypothetical protein
MGLRANLEQTTALKHYYLLNAAVIKKIYTMSRNKIINLVNTCSIIGSMGICKIYHILSFFRLYYIYQFQM